MLKIDKYNNLCCERCDSEGKESKIKFFAITPKNISVYSSEFTGTYKRVYYCHYCGNSFAENIDVINGIETNRHQVKAEG